MPGNDDNPRDQRTLRDDHAAHTPTDPPTTPDSLNGATPPIDEHDLLGIVEGTIDRHRLRAIRDTLANDRQLLATLARMKRDRETLQNADPEHAAPATLVHDAVAKAAATTLGFDDLSAIDAPPAWPTDHSEAAKAPVGDAAANSPKQRASTANHAAAGRISPTASGHRRRFGWKARTALAAAVLLVGGGAILITAMLGGLDPDRRPTRTESPRVALAIPENQSDEINQELIDAHDAEMLRREELADELMRLVDRSGVDAPPLDEIDLDDILRGGQSIDQMLAQIAEELIDGSVLTGAIPPVSDAADPVRELIDTSGISIAAIGRLARSGRLHVSLEARDPIRAAAALLNPNAGGDYDAELIAFADMDSADWTGAVPIARGPGRHPLASPPPTDERPAAPETDPQLARVQQLLREIHEREAGGGIDGERSDLVYRVEIAGLRRLNDESAGLEVIRALERMVSAGDRIAFYELAGAGPQPTHAAADEPGFTVQMYVRERGRDRR